MTYKGSEKVFGSQVDEQQHCYMSAFYNYCDPVMEPITKGFKLMFIYSLVWKDMKMTIPQNLPVFISAVKKIEDALASWLPQQPVEPVTDGLFQEGNRTTGSTSSSIPKTFTSLNAQSQQQVDHALLEVNLRDTMNNPFETVQNEQHKELRKKTDMLFSCSQKNALHEDVLFFVLEEKYLRNDLMFRRLRGKDRDLAHLLQCCQFLDVHLAVVTHKNTLITKERSKGASSSSNASDGAKEVKESSSFKISRWIDSEDISKNLRVEFNFEKQLIGPQRNLWTSDGIKPDKKKTIYIQHDCDCKLKIKEHIFYHAVLVIWPKHQSFRMYCNYGLGSLLNCMESSLGSTPPNLQEQVRGKVAEDLRKIITCCCTKPVLVWMQWAKSMGIGELTARLLQMCTTLQLREEGLALLNMLDVEFVHDGYMFRTKTFEGIKSEQVAQAIAEFQCKVTGRCH